MNDPQRPPGAATTVKAHLRIVDVNTGKVKLDFEPVSAATYVTPGSSLIPIARGIDLSTLADGPYRLEVQATAAGQDTPWRAVNFEVDRTVRRRLQKYDCSSHWSRCRTSGAIAEHGAKSGAGTNSLHFKNP